MFAGVARYVCKPQMTIVLSEVSKDSLLRAVRSAEKMVSLSQGAAADGGGASACADSALRSAPSPLKNGLASICGDDAKLTRMIQRHLDESKCAVTRTKGIDLDTMLRRDHNIPLGDFLSLSTVNRKILLLDSLRRNKADVDAAADETPILGGLRASERRDMILERGRSLLLELHRNAAASQKKNH